VKDLIEANYQLEYNICFEMSSDISNCCKEVRNNAYNDAEEYFMITGRRIKIDIEDD